MRKQLFAGLMVVTGELLINRCSVSGGLVEQNIRTRCAGGTSTAPYVILVNGGLMVKIHL